MSLTTAMFTGLTGMSANSKNLDVIGNNIVNVNTVGFKSSRGIFENQLSLNLGFGTAPSAEFGGTNPVQIGLGVKFAGTLANFSNGAIQTTGVATDLALEGNGFFILRNGDQTTFTRAGHFDLDATQNLVSIDGGVVQGFQVDRNFNLTQTVGDIHIPLGSLSVAEATRNVNFSGNLNAAGDIAQNGTRLTSQAFFSDALATVPALATDLLTDLRATAGPAEFALGQVITVQGAEKGGRNMGTHTFEVGAANTTGSDAFGTTFQDFLDFLNQVLGIHEAVPNGSGVTPGISVVTAAQALLDPTLSAGQILVEGNQGTVNDIRMQTNDIVTNGAVAQPFVWSRHRDADGESVTTTFVVFDSLGSPLTVDLSVVLESRSNAGTSWRFYVESIDDTDLDRVLETGLGVGGNGLLNFDNFGQLLNVVDPRITLDRTGSGAADPLNVQLNFTSAVQNVTALTDVRSVLAAAFQDGSPIGTLHAFGVAENGVINGAFTNGLVRQIGQIALATFTNPEGLRSIGSNQYLAGPNSGLPVTVAPQTLGSARILAGNLELSNVDLSTEFVNLINTSAAFSASSRVITTADQLLQQLLLLGR